MARAIPDKDVAACIVHWLAFESLCGRKYLFAESSLRYPLGQIIAGRGNGWTVVAEEPYPLAPGALAPRGRPRAADFAFRRPGGAGALVELVESKLIRANSQPQNIVADLIKLESAIQPPPPAEKFTRRVIVAGADRDVDGLFVKGFCDATLGAAIPNPFIEGAKDHVRVYAWNGVALHEHWRNAANVARIDELPTYFEVHTVGKARQGGFSAWVWKVTRMKRRHPRSLVVESKAGEGG